MIEVNLKITEVTSPTDPVIEEALILLNRTQGDGLYDRDYLIQKIESSNAYLVVGSINNTLVAVGGAVIVEDFKFYTPFDSKIETRLAEKRVGSFNTLSVLETHQGKGIGQTISRERLKWLTAKDCDVILGISWVSGLRNTSNRVFEKLGFQKISEVPAFFQNGSSYQSFTCPGCGNKPCTCNAILFERWL